MLERRRAERRTVIRGYGDERRLQRAPEPPRGLFERRGPQRRVRDRRLRDRRRSDDPLQLPRTTDDAH
jgi:hypothetical protein